MVFNKLINSYPLIFNLFLESSISPLYNKNITNSITQKKITINNNETNNFKNLYLVKDIPSYVKFSVKDLGASTKLKTIIQYNGFLVNLKNYTNTTTYINKNLSKRNRKNLKSKSNKLFSTHNISSKFYFGEITKQEYNSIFNAFYLLLKNRFDQKKTYNRYLSNWSNLQALTFKKIIDRKASLHVIFDDLNPIAITLNYHLGDIVFSHIQTFNIAYSKYNLGDICMVNHINWLIKNNIAVFDLSIGENYYKKKWCNHQYHFAYHIFYNNNSFLSKISANIILQELKLMQFLRDKNIAGKLFNLDKLLYKYKNLT